MTAMDLKHWDGDTAPRRAFRGACTSGLPHRARWHPFRFVPALLVWVALPLEPLHAEAFSLYVKATTAEAAITVFPNERATYRIPRTLFGTFLEHIGDSVFGGVSAQLLDNPSLEPYPAIPSFIEKRFAAAEFQRSTAFGLPLPWLPLRASGRRYEARQGNAANSNSYLYVMGLRGREVGIRQSLYLPIERESQYRGILFARAAEGAASLSVSFRRHARPDDILAQSRLAVAEEGKWIKIPFDLKVPAGALAPLEQVDLAIAVEDGGRISLDEIRLYPADAVDGLDPEIVRRARELSFGLLRYGGNFSSGYHWRDGVGPLDSRPTRLNQTWGIPEYNDFGTDELMEFCRRVGVLPQICLNMGSGGAEEARRWVEYCQGAAGTVEGRRRAFNGHPQPYAVGAWEFGNELYDSTQLGWYAPAGYALRYLEFFRKIEPLVPRGMPLLATGGELPAFEKWNGELLRQAGPQLRFVTTHIVADLEETLNKSLDRAAVTAAALALPVGVGRLLGRIRTQIDAVPATRNRVKLAYTEWLFRSPPGSALPNFDNMGGAVIAAAWLNTLALDADWIPIANMTGLVEFAGIHKARGRTYVTPQYWVLSLYSRLAGDTVIKTETQVAQYDVHGGQPFAPEIPAVPYLDVLGTSDSKSGDFTLFVVNRNPREEQPATVRIQDAKPGHDARIWQLSAPSLLEKNDEEHQNAVAPRESHATIEGTALRHVFPPASVTVFSFSAQ